jgi:23S rRNA pseudouridine1911/1915/1917 synthase
VAAPAPNRDVPLAIAHDDGEVLIVVKDRGVVTRPGEGHERDSLLNGVVAVPRYGERLLALGERRDYGLLHRLDRATSGLVAIALSAEAYDVLRDAFATRRVEKTYLALVRPAPPKLRGTIRMRLLETRRLDRKIALVDPRGEDAITHYATHAVGRDGGAIVSCRIETGRLHQIRAHLAWLGSPLAGDAVYGGPRAPDGRGSSARIADREILLHAWRLVLPRRSGRSIAVEAPLPEHWETASRKSGIPLRKILKSLARSARGRALSAALARRRAGVGRQRDRTFLRRGSDASHPFRGGAA